MSPCRGYAGGVNLWLDGLLAAGRLMAEAATESSLDAVVPTCPDWTLRDLVHHVGGVHRWATYIVGDEMSEFPDDPLATLVGGWPSDDELTDWLLDGVDHLYEALDAAAPDMQCVTFLEAASPVDMWMRRMCHETSIHRVDAELAAGDVVTPIPPVEAADGVDELVSCWITRRGGRLRSSSAVKRMSLRTTDADEAWLLRIGPDGVTTRRSAGPADCAIAGTAHDLFVTLWHRGDPSILDVKGEAKVLDLFLDKVQVRWA